MTTQSDINNGRYPCLLRESTPGTSDGGLGIIERYVSFVFRRPVGSQLPGHCPPSPDSMASRRAAKSTGEQELDQRGLRSLDIVAQDDELCYPCCPNYKRPKARL